MNDMRKMIDETAGRIFSDLCTKEVVDAAESGAWPEELWRTLEESGLTLASVTEELGGGGGTIGDSMAILRQAGRHAAPIPLAETVLAGWILSESGLPVPSGPLTVAVPQGADQLSISPAGEGLWNISGTALRVPWAAAATHIVVVGSNGATPMVAITEPAHFEIEPGTCLAGEPRDTVVCTKSEIHDRHVQPAGPLVDAESIEELGALTRAVLMAGALETILSLSIEHANTREQFGRPIGAFQAVRQQLAVLTGHVAAAGKAADVAANAADAGDGRHEVAIAKARIGEAVGIGTEIAHQVHGAMGITYEHSLHHYTRRLWTWRDEYGAEPKWQAELGRQAAAKGPEGLWQFISQT